MRNGLGNRELYDLIGVNWVSFVDSFYANRPKCRVDLELIALEEYLGVWPANRLTALEGETAPMSSSG